MFADLDETIRLLLIQHVPLPAEVDVSFEAPDRDWLQRWSGRPTVNCFLYDVRENLEFRESDWSVERANGKATLRGGPLLIDGTYHITVWAKAPEDEHRLLWRVLAAMMRHRTIPKDVLQGQLADQPFPVRAQAAQPNQTRSNPADLWQAVDNRIRPGLSYVVTLALDPQIQLGPVDLISSRTVLVKRRDEPTEHELDADDPRMSANGRASLEAGRPVPIAEQITDSPRVVERDKDKLRVRDDDDLINLGGRVVDKEGHAVAGATVRLHNARRPARTDEHGRFLIRRVHLDKKDKEKDKDKKDELAVQVRIDGQKKDRTQKVTLPSGPIDIEI